MTTEGLRGLGWPGLIQIRGPDDDNIATLTENEVRGHVRVEDPRGPLTEAGEAVFDAMIGQGSSSGPQTDHRTRWLMAVRALNDILATNNNQ